jgi:hypothetical protein
METKTLLFILLALTAIASFAGATGTDIGACRYLIGNTSTYLLNNTCNSEILEFAYGVSGASVRCTNSSPGISEVDFDGSTYNNTMMNCTFANAEVLSAHGAFNNLVSPRGKYNLTFFDNDSNIALGYNFVFVPRLVNGSTSEDKFAEMIPYGLVKRNPGEANNQELSMKEVKLAAARDNFMLPRFGLYLPTGLPGNNTFVLETLQISKNGTKSFNPYWFECPYWGSDILSYYRFNLTHDMEYTPMFLSPELAINVQLPDNTNVFWNYTVRDFSNSTNITAYLFPSYQFSGAKPVKVMSNFSPENGKLSYDAGKQKTGIHQFITELRSVHNGTFEQSNATTVNYATGLAYCTEEEMQIGIPGYYSMAFKNLTRLYLYHPTGKTCGVAVRIVVNNVTIDCKGGTINSTYVDFLVNNAKNLVVQNCALRGNVLNAHSASVLIANSTVTANERNDTAFLASRSNVALMNTVVTGYDNYAELTNSSVLLNLSTAKGTSTISGNYTQTGTAPKAVYSYGLLCFDALLAASGAALIVYSLICGRRRRKDN